MSTPMDRMRGLMEIEPPAFLDALVRERATALLARRQDSETPSSETHGEASARPPQAGGIPTAERWVYIVGLLTYGSQALLSAARLVARTLAG